MPWCALVGEAWGAEEEKAKAPFIGPAGLLLNSCLSIAGIKRDECLVTNVFNLRPPSNKLDSILVSKDYRAEGYSPVRKGKYLPADLVPELERLRAELHAAKPKVIVTLGSTALWALTGENSLAPRRGHLHYWSGIPMIPTHHPARVLRQYHLKHTLAGDLVKAKALADGKLHPAVLQYTPEPTIQQVRDFFALVKQRRICAVDIENLIHTRAITCIGFGIPEHSICVPFFHEHKQGYSYWQSAEEEAEAFQLIKDLLEDDSVSKIFHHFVHDIPYIADVWGIRVRGPVSDTRIMHSVMFAELSHTLSDVTADWELMPPWKALHKSNKDSDVAGSDGDE